MDSNLRLFYPNITIPSLENRELKLKCPSIRFKMINYSRFKALIKKNSIRNNKNYYIGQYPVAFYMFDKYREEIFNEFSLKENIEHEVQNALQTIKLTVNSSDLIFVGVHVRRADYGRWMKKRMTGGFVTPNFFKRAMEIYREKFKGRSIVFVVTSDDRGWSKKHLEGPDVVFPVPKFEYITKNEHKSFDMAILNKCNHSIFE